MNIHPIATSKVVGEAEPGELLKLTWGPQTGFAIASTIVRDRPTADFLTFLSAGDVALPGQFFQSKVPQTKVLSLGTQYRIDFDIHSEVDFDASKHWGTIGALCIAGDRAYLRVQQVHQPGSSFDGFLDMGSGLILGGEEMPSKTRVFIPRWTLRLPGDPDGRAEIDIVSFAAPSR
jgi:hypothetical protein